MAEINIPDSVKTIGYEAFNYCESLINASIGNNVSAIAPGTFYDCGRLDTVSLGDSITSIGNDAFNRCGNLTSINIPNNVTSIGERAFSDCRSLTAITIPDKVTSIGYKAFSSCTVLTEVNIPDSVTFIGDGAFAYCDELMNVYMGNSVSAIGDQTFYLCSNLEKITLSDSVTSIGDDVFCNCRSLTAITIPCNVTSIGDSAFYNCTGLTKITIPESIAVIKSRAFERCNSLTDVYYGGVLQQWQLIDIGTNNDRLTQANIHYNGSMYGQIKSALCNYENGKISVNINFSFLANNGFFIFAVYDNGNLITTKTLPVTADNLSYNLEFDADESWLDYDVKLFCWEDTLSQKPISRAFNTNITPIVSVDNVLESEHPYALNIDETKTYIYDGICESIDVTFSDDTYVEDNFDFIYLYDGNDVLIGEYTGGELSGRTINFPGNTVKIRLASDNVNSTYGYRTERIIVNK